MQVSELQQYFRNLSAVLQAGKAKTAANSLESVTEALQPFSRLSVDQFSNFLQRAEEYHRTGIVPVQSASKSKRKSAAMDPEAVKQVSQKTLSLLERVMDDSVSYKDIETHMKTVGKLKAAEVKEVAKELGIPGSFKTKGAAVSSISELLTSKKQTGIVVNRI